MCAIDSEAALTDRTVRNLHRSDRNITKKADQILDIIETDRHATTRILTHWPSATKQFEII